jgi:hypothetical protein
MSLREVNLMGVADKGARRGPRKFVQGSIASSRHGSRLQSRHIDENGSVSFGHGTGSETLRSSIASARVEGKPPAMVAANELIAFDFALA